MRKMVKLEYRITEQELIKEFYLSAEDFCCEALRNRQLIDNVQKYLERRENLEAKALSSKFGSFEIYSTREGLTVIVAK